MQEEQDKQYYFLQEVNALQPCIRRNYFIYILRVCTSVNPWRTEHKQIINLNIRGSSMNKRLYGKYLDDIDNIGVNLPYCVVQEHWISMRYPFQYNIFTTSHV